MICQCGCGEEAGVYTQTHGSAMQFSTSRNGRLRMDSKEYVIRTQSDRAFTYALGEVVAPNCAYFVQANIGLSLEELNAKLKQLGKVTLR